MSIKCFKFKLTKKVRNLISIVIVLGIMLNSMCIFPGNTVKGATLTTPMVLSALGHNVALANDGTVWAWGSNGYGQLGDGTTTNRSLPVKVSGLTNIISIAGEGYHHLALKSDGTVWTWGYNNHGQLADSSKSNKSTPVQVQGVSGIKAIAAGLGHSMVLKNDGTVLSWGQNDHGQLGNSKSIDSATPVALSKSVTSISAIDCGANFSVVLKSDGTVWSWGENVYGQLGNGDTTSGYNSYASKLSALSSIVSINAGYDHCMALKSDGKLYVWGNSYYGQLGDGYSGYSAKRFSPYALMTGVSKISSGNWTSMIQKNDGTFWVWGRNESGQLGDGTTTQRTRAVQISGLTDIISFASGSIVLKSDGTVWNCGSNDMGQLGVGTKVSSSSYIKVIGLNLISAVVPPAKPVNLTLVSDDVNCKATISWNAVEGATGYNIKRSTTAGGPYTTIGSSTTQTYTDSNLLKNVTYYYVVSATNTDGESVNSNEVSVIQKSTELNRKIISAFNHGIALRNDGTVWAWGRNDYGGSLGDGTTTNRVNPLQVQGLTGVVAIAGEYYHHLALKSDGTVWAWGLNEYGQLGDGTTINRSTPVQIPGLTGVVSIAAGYSHSMVLKSDGTLWSWGRNLYGQLGNGSDTDSYTPKQVYTYGMSGITAIDCGGNFSIALQDNGTIRTWGENTDGELGLGDETLGCALTPQKVPNLNNVIMIDAGYNHCLALKTDGVISGWGSNSNGQLGEGIQEYRYYSPVVTLSNVARMSAGCNSSMALKKDGTVWTWGENSTGELGDGTVVDKTRPVPITGLTEIIDISTGGCNSLLLKNDGTVLVSGDNSSHQLSVTSISQRSTFEQVNGIDITP